MFSLVLFISALGMALGTPTGLYSNPSPVYYSNSLGPVHTVTKSQFHTQDGLGQYAYGYSDGLSSKTESKSFDGITHGSYSYLDPHGVVQNVNYIADDVNGFRVAASNLPVGPAAVPVNSNVIPVRPSGPGLSPAGLPVPSHDHLPSPEHIYAPVQQVPPLHTIPAHQGPLYSESAHQQYPFQGQQHSDSSHQQYPFQGHLQSDSSHQQYPFQGQLQSDSSHQQYPFQGQLQSDSSHQQYPFQGQVQSDSSHQQYPYPLHPGYYPGGGAYNEVLPQYDPNVSPDEDSVSVTAARIFKDHIPRPVQDTPEVSAAKVQHMAAVQKATAAHQNAAKVDYDYDSSSDDSDVIHVDPSQHASLDAMPLPSDRADTPPHSHPFSPYQQAPGVGSNVLTQYHQQDNLGQYSYGYAGGPSAKTEVKTRDGVTRGSYSYVDARGQIQRVRYVSDEKHGFRVAASNLPLAPLATAQ